MKGILEFSLPEEQEDFETAQNGSKWKSVAWGLDQVLRSVVKHEALISGQKVNTKDAEIIRDALWELIKEEGLEL